MYIFYDVSKIIKHCSAVVVQDLIKEGFFAILSQDLLNLFSGAKKALLSPNLTPPQVSNIFQVVLLTFDNEITTRKCQKEGLFFYFSTKSLLSGLYAHTIEEARPIERRNMENCDFFIIAQKNSCEKEKQNQISEVLQSRY